MSPLRSCATDASRRPYLSKLYGAGGRGWGDGSRMRGSRYALQTQSPQLFISVGRAVIGGAHRGDDDQREATRLITRGINVYEYHGTVALHTSPRSSAVNRMPSELDARRRSGRRVATLAPRPSQPDGARAPPSPQRSRSPPPQQTELQVCVCVCCNQRRAVRHT